MQICDQDKSADLQVQLFLSFIWPLHAKNALICHSELADLPLHGHSNYSLLEHDSKVSIASKCVVDMMKPARSHSRTLFRESTVFVFGAVDPMVARLFLMLGG